ncbi:hypothetical protein OB955_05915 [Halobacteria archaeon AArc-m2/3/4]|uniref:DUF7130 domain-containing protein n=1 Tax=Natronoglomus mannanivorans TaxID=2979990 RepID=A0AAP3E3L9_9EURY|nr:hypothetical protein [Halobacteria archaeon AArc-xg1-1]MCU4972270.1 hypothetical protein [Halobacteria archaeon AArc-m2/3/4]
MSDSTNTTRLGFGTAVYVEDGTKIGTVRGIDEDGVHVTFRQGLEELSVEHIRSTPDFGEAELMWKCLECGRMGELDRDLPSECPDCGVSKEQLYYWTED